MRSLFVRRFCFSTLILAEHNNKAINNIVKKLLSAAQKLSQPRHLLIVGKDVSSVVKSVQSSIGNSSIDKMIVAESPQLQNYVADSYDHIIKTLMEKYKYQNVVALSSSFGKDIIPRVAAQFNCQAISDVVEIEKEDTFVRPTYAGNAISKVQSNAPIKFLTIRSTSFDEIAPGTSENVEIENIELGQIKSNTQFVGSQESDSGKPELTTAKVVVAGGRGIKSKENFKLVEELASALNGAVGASRAAVDAGYCANQMQVGQTGKIVAPELYIAIGISGAVQHLAGMKDSKVIVAINNKNEEPIFELATYGLVGDLFKILPELTDKLKQLKQ